MANLLTQLAARGERHLPSCDPSAYCQARRRLPARVVTQLRHHVAQRMDDLITSEHTWLGRRVKVFDGSSLSMPDTPELQAAFPQPPGQAAGCGFPVVQIVALFCWTTGALIDLAVDTIRPHELTLFRRLWHHLVPGDVVLGDRAYGSYVDLARPLQRGVYGGRKKGTFYFFKASERRKSRMSPLWLLLAQCVCRVAGDARSDRPRGPSFHDPRPRGRRHGGRILEHRPLGTRDNHESSMSAALYLLSGRGL